MSREEGQGLCGARRASVRPQSNLQLLQPQPCRELLRRGLRKMPEPPCLSRTQPKPLPGTLRHESLIPGIHGCVQGEVNGVGEAQSLPGRGLNAPPGH